MSELRQREPRVLCPGYLEWLRKQGCACGCKSAPPSDPAHIRSGSIRHGKRPTGMAEKPDDRWAVPLNRVCHMRQHDFGDELGWWSAHGIDPFGTAEYYFGQYSKQADAILRRAGMDRLVRKPNRTAKIASRKQPWPKRKMRSQLRDRP
jgi:hypothetical protein